MTFRASTAQKARIRSLLRPAEFDQRTVTFAFRRIGVHEMMIGRTVDEWLDGISMSDASRAINSLEEICDEDSGD